MDLISRNTRVSRNNGTAFVQSLPLAHESHGMAEIITAQPAQHAFYQSGLTLLEIMVTVVILSLGLLGLAGLQMTGLKNNRNAYYQTLAAQVVQDVGERLRVDSATLETVIKAGSKNISTNSAKCTGVKNPTFDSRVACLVSVLPEGRVQMTMVEDNPKSLLIAVRWRDLQLNNEFGWGTGTVDSDPAKPDRTACGNRVRDMSCYYSWFRP